MKLRTLTIGSLALVVTAFAAPTTADAYFKTVGSLYGTNSAPVVYRHLLNRGASALSPVYRSQRDRVTSRRGPVTVDYNYNLQVGTMAMATEGEARERIKDLFDKVGSQNIEILTDSDTYTNADLDLRGLVSHKCFAPVGSEIEECKMTFGSYYNLRESMLDGSLYAVIVTNNPGISPTIRGLYTKTMMQVREELGSNQDMSMSAMLRMQKRARSAAVWDICNALYNGDEVGRCFAKHNRLYLDLDLDQSDLEFNIR